MPLPLLYSFCRKGTIRCTNIFCNPLLFDKAIWQLCYLLYNIVMLFC
uniref:Uncharacterized protein n=1 Tax=Anguilla anguilla TaxID=7936 RepID=A0A0E9VNY1_ANGAN